MVNEIIIPEKEKNLMYKLEIAGFKAYIVGGFVRDSLLGVEAHDVDIFTNATGEQILEVFPNGKVIGNEERQEKILTVVVDGVEISQFRKNGDRTETGNNLIDHQRTCDFYMNAIAINRNGQFKGHKDINRQGVKNIEEGTVMAVGNPYTRFTEDGLRILRALRQADKLNFKIEGGTFTAIVKFNLNNIAKERIWDEFMKVLPYLKERHIHLWADKMFPKEWFNLNMLLSGGDFHDEHPREHLIGSLQAAQKITDNPLKILAAFFHDIGKSVTRSETERGCSHYAFTEKGLKRLKDYEVHFYEHEKKGREIVEDWMKEYKCSNDAIKYVSTLVKRHMFGYQSNPSKKAYNKLFRELEEAKVSVEDLVDIIWCDYQGNRLKTGRVTYEYFIKNSMIHYTYEEMKNAEVPFDIHQMAIKGKDLIELGMKPGKEMGDLLKALFERVISGELENNKEVLLLEVGMEVKSDR